MKTFENSKIPRVFELMQEKGVKGAQITRDLGVSSGNISDWKSGKASPSSAVLVALANYLDTTVEYLTGESDEKESSVGITVSLTSEESALIESYRNSPENVRKAVKALLDFGG